MRRFTLFFMLFAAAIGLGVVTPSGRAFAKEAKKGKLLYLTLSAGFHHDVVPFSTEIMKKIAEKSGAFEVTITDDVSPFTAEGLKPYDAVMFYTTGELPMTDDQKKAFVNFIRSGHGFIGVHSATDTFYLWEDYHDLIGGYFNGHPWHQQLTVDVADPNHKIVAFLGKSIQLNDELYQIDDFDPRTSHVLLKLDPGSVDIKKQGSRPKYYGWPVAWTRMDGKGRMFYCSLGHEHDVWNSDWYQQLLLNAVQWVMGRTK